MRPVPPAGVEGGGDTPGGEGPGVAGGEGPGVVGGGEAVPVPEVHCTLAAGRRAGREGGGQLQARQSAGGGSTTACAAATARLPEPVPASYAQGQSQAWMALLKARPAGQALRQYWPGPLQS